MRHRAQPNMSQTWHCIQHVLRICAFDILAQLIVGYLTRPRSLHLVSPAILSMQEVASQLLIAVLSYEVIAYYVHRLIHHHLLYKHIQHPHCIRCAIYNDNRAYICQYNPNCRAARPIVSACTACFCPHSFSHLSKWFWEHSVFHFSN